MARSEILRCSLGSSALRGIALFLGLFTILSCISELRAPGFNANLWWIQLPVNRGLVEQSLLLWSAASLIWFAARRRLTRVEKLGLSITFGMLLAASAWNALSYWQVLYSGQIQSPCVVPFSGLVALYLSLLLRDARRATPQDVGGKKTLQRLTVAITFVSCAFLFPLAQMYFFGKTDYRRPADAIVVFGAKIFEDGQLSWVLEERVQTGCELYHQGLAREILFSGGPGEGQVHEAEGMRLRAMELGVPESAILVDLNGVDTDSSVINAVRMKQARKWNRLLAVSTFFHLPRIKLAFHRHGSEVYTVPAKRLRIIPQMPYFMLREIAAWWWYYIRPLA